MTLVKLIDNDIDRMEKMSDSEIEAFFHSKLYIVRPVVELPATVSKKTTRTKASNDTPLLKIAELTPEKAARLAKLRELMAE